MGLDQYAYVALRARQREEFYETCIYEDGELVSSSVQKPRELACWRKHPNLQRWMELLWLEKIDVPLVESDQFLENKYPPTFFNGVEVELTWNDLDRLERDINAEKVASLNATGFFFGNPSDDYYRDQDLQFIRDARAEIFSGFRVFYNSSW